MNYKEFMKSFIVDSTAKDDSGFEEMYAKRNEKKASLRAKLKEKYFLAEEELDYLFEAIERAEIEIENMKQTFPKSGFSQEDLDKFYKKIVERQELMQAEFEEKLAMTIKFKYEAAKKMLNDIEGL